MYERRKYGDLMQNKWGREELGHSLEELAALGSPVDLSVVQEDLSLNIEQGGGPSDSIIFDLPHHRAGYILDIELLNLRSKTIYLVDLILELAWEDPWFQWLPDPETQNHNAKKAQGNKLKRTRMQPPPRYCFPSSNGLEFPRDRVLNHYLTENGKLTQKPMRGLLLAIGGRMPDSLRHGSLLEASLVVRDVEGFAYRGAVTFCVERRDVMTKPQTQNLGLFEPARANYGSRIADPVPLLQAVARDNLAQLRCSKTIRLQPV
jgi:hypothetical protein